MPLLSLFFLNDRRRDVIAYSVPDNWGRVKILKKIQNVNVYTHSPTEKMCERHPQMININTDHMAIAREQPTVSKHKSFYYLFQQRRFFLSAPLAFFYRR